MTRDIVRAAGDWQSPTDHPTDGSHGIQLIQPDGPTWTCELGRSGEGSRPPPAAAARKRSGPRTGSARKPPGGAGLMGTAAISRRAAASCPPLGRSRSRRSPMRRIEFIRPHLLRYRARQSRPLAHSQEMTRPSNRGYNNIAA
jgi:hypothetical protein